MKLNDQQKDCLKGYLNYFRQLTCETAENIIKLILNTSVNAQQTTSASVSLLGTSESEATERLSKLVLELKTLVFADKTRETAESKANAFLLGYCYEFGIGLEKDLKQAFELYHALAEKGDVFALTVLGEMELTGKGVVKKDEKQAFDHFKQAGEKGYACAQFWLADCYEKAIGCTEDVKRAFEYYKLAAEQSHGSAQNALGDFYREGKVGDIEIPLALHYYRLAADQDNRDAQNNLGCMHSDGTLPVDHKLAFTYYSRAAQDPDLTVAHALLAACYYHGTGTPKNLTLAVKHYTIAASQNDPSALFMLGYMYDNGQGDLPVDLDQAIKYYNKAIEAGELEGLYYLGSLLKKRKDVASMRKAFECFKAGAKQNNINCMNALGECYEHGLGLDRRMPELAAEVYSKVAKLAESPDATPDTKSKAQYAQVSLGNLLFTGKLIAMDKQRSYDLYKLAAESGNETASYNLRKLFVLEKRPENKTAGVPELSDKERRINAKYESNRTRRVR